MQLKHALFVVATVLSSAMVPAVNAGAGDVLTATRILQEVIRESPFLVDRTETVTWTQSTSITETTTATPIPDTVETAPATIS
ncbi:hypothetical protein D9611_000556 [Ephemerocybe angulata]|uniref:Uncharacterized protein n=1 Tax=Ephemerocybe angulata TaxID=980116 RepID=A0A8H5F781_9AGAR|nr:hypothetical protein D9611_000556 [Tulosesus angulatus]